MPEGSKNSRYKSYADLDENSSFLQLPEIDGAEYLIDLLREAGMFLSTGMGAVCLTWQEIHDWLEVTERKLTVWEKLTIKTLSEAYTNEFNQASAKDRPAPFIFIDEEARTRTTVANKLLSVLRSFKKPPDK